MSPSSGTGNKRGKLEFISKLIIYIMWCLINLFFLMQYRNYKEKNRLLLLTTENRIQNLTKIYNYLFSVKYTILTAY